MDKCNRNKLDHYIGFVKMERADIDAAHAAWTIIEPHLQGLIDGFYRHLFESGFEDRFRGQNLPAIKQKQLDYWDILFSGNIGGAYQAHVNYIAEKHRLAGVELTDYIGSYAWFSQRFYEIISRSQPPNGFKRSQMLAAVNKAIYLDMMIATGASDIYLLDI